MPISAQQITCRTPLGHTITGDHAGAMKRGPVSSQVYDLIRGLSSRAGDWGRLIRTERYEVELVAETGRGELSKGEVQTLLEVSERYRDLDEWSLSDETHEWQLAIPRLRPADRRLLQIGVRRNAGPKSRWVDEWRP